MFKDFWILLMVIILLLFIIIMYIYGSQLQDKRVITQKSKIVLCCAQFESAVEFNSNFEQILLIEYEWLINFSVDYECFVPGFRIRQIVKIC